MERFARWREPDLFTLRAGQVATRPAPTKSKTISKEAEKFAEMFANEGAHIQDACRCFADFVGQEGFSEACKKLQAINPALNQQIFDRMLELGRSPTSRPLDEYLRLGICIG